MRIKRIHSSRCLPGGPLGLLLLAVLFTPGVVSGQAVPGWPGLDPGRLPTVYVLDDANQETAGRLLRLNPDSLVLLVDGTERRFEASRVKRLSRHGDSLKNGAYIGAVVGVVQGILAGGFADCVDDAGRVGSCGAAARVAFAAISTAIYAAIGAGIDALIPGRITLYDASAIQPAAAGQTRSMPRRSCRSAAIGFGLSW